MNEIEFILSSLLNCPRSDLYTKEISVDTNLELRLNKILDARLRREPLQYLLEKTEFMGLDFKVTSDVFIPRPETEILVETAINIVKRFKSLKGQRLNILDIGTGSGCIAISLAKFLKNIKIIATDISKEALKIAQLNAALHNVSRKIKFIESNLFNKLLTGKFNKTFDLIISNPPYIASAELENLQPEVRYEPVVALDGGIDGLDFYRRIISESPKFLKDKGLLIMEMGFGQAPDIKNILKKQEKFEILDIIKDYQGIPRIIIAEKNG